MTFLVDLLVKVLCVLLELIFLLFCKCIPTKVTFTLFFNINIYGCILPLVYELTPSINSSVGFNITGESYVLLDNEFIFLLNKEIELSVLLFWLLIMFEYVSP